MELNREQAAHILQQISANQWKWLGIKRFVAEDYADLSERYAALERHHEQETGRMIEVIESLCRLVASSG